MNKPRIRYDPSPDMKCWTCELEINGIAFIGVGDTQKDAYEDFLVDVNVTTTFLEKYHGKDKK